ncbi:Rz1-like lysis system protein LysC [Mangrovibacter phragmitis]|uniref:Rz1-like lysis system protein LysC n=1 Tax=Mangrovibacter phragmitis TaxID=1691903 RepID=UPI003F792FC8
MIALNSLFLPLLLSSCASTQIEYVPVQPVPLPASLLIDCVIPQIPEQMTYGDSLKLNESLLGVIDKCNQDKADIRKAEQKRQETTK